MELLQPDRIATPVNMIILNDNNQVLLLRREEKEDQFVGTWSIPGGGPKPGEDFEKALEREILEEVGCKILEKDYFKSFYFIVNPKLHVRSIYFYGKIMGAIQISDEHSEFKWFNKDELKNLNIAFNQKEILEKFFIFNS